MSDNQKTDQKNKEPKRKPFWMRLVIVCLYFCFICYVSLGISSTFLWAKTVYYQNKDFSKFVSIVDEYREIGKLNAALEYINAQPYTLHEEITDSLVKNAPKYEPIFYFEISKRLMEKYEQIKDKDEIIAEEYAQQAIFWSMLGRFRIHIDTRKCAPGDTSEKLADNLSALLTPTKLSFIGSLPFEHVAPYLVQVLVWDDKHPPQAGPDFICSTIYNTQKGDLKVKTDPNSWERVRENYRLSTWISLRTHNEKVGAENALDLPDLMELSPPKTAPISAPISGDTAEDTEANKKVAPISKEEAMDALEETEEKAP